MTEDRRAPLTCNMDCPRCKGAGVVLGFVRTGPIRIGGQVNGVKTRALCSCVRVEADK